MITRQMKLDLLDLGYTIRDINSLTPLKAHEIITNRIIPPKTPAVDKNQVSGEEEDCSPNLSDPQIPQKFSLHTKVPEHSQEHLKKHLANVNRIQSGLGNVKLKVNQTLVSIDIAEQAISVALKKIQK